MKAAATLRKVQAEGQNAPQTGNGVPCISESWQSRTDFRPRPISKWLRASESNQHLFEELAACAVGTTQPVEQLRDLLSLWQSRDRPDLGVWPEETDPYFNLQKLRALILTH
jgi:hypothetical protein